MFKVYLIRVLIWLNNLYSKCILFNNVYNDHEGPVTILNLLLKQERNKEKKEPSKNNIYDASVCVCGHVCV